jgi:hypothetical protein
VSGRLYWIEDDIDGETWLRVMVFVGMLRLEAYLAAWARFVSLYGP